MNKAIIMGRLTRDPEIRYSQSAEPMAIARYTLAVNRRFKREGEPDADFIPCVVFGKGAEFAEKYLKKGMMIAASGRIQVRSWDDQNGTKRWSTEIVVDEQDFAESRSSFENRAQNFQPDPYGSAPQPSSPAPSGVSGFSPIEQNIEDDDLPF